MTEAPLAPLAAIEATALGVAMRQSLWLYPAVEIVHICGFVIVVGSIVVLDLRLLGLARDLPVRALVRHVVPWALGGLLLIIPSGLLMFAAQAVDLVANRVFQLKLLLLLLVGTNGAVFHTGVYRGVTAWNSDAAPPLAAKVHAAASLLLWFSILACGRLLAYI